MKNLYDALLLLGVELDENDAPTEELRARVSAAAQAFSCGDVDKLVVCGGTLPGHAVSEADVMTRLLAEQGVPQNRIVRENQSQDTMENLRFAAGLLGGARGKRVLIVTSDYHLTRALWTARRVGFRAKGFAARRPRDAAWRSLWLKEHCYRLDLVMGWQDEGRHRPDFVIRLFERVFGKR